MSARKSVHTGPFCERTEHPKKSFDSKSFRWVKSGKSRILVGCPKGSWEGGKRMHCRVGMRAYKILVPVPKGVRCPRRQRRIVKG